MPRVAAEGGDGLQVHYLTVRVKRFAIRIYHQARHVLLNKLIETPWAVNRLSGLKRSVPGVVAPRTFERCGDNESHTNSSPAVHRQAVELGEGLQREFGLGFALPDRRAVVRFDAVGNYVGPLAGGGRGVHAEAADTAAVYRGVRGVG